MKTIYYVMIIKMKLWQGFLLLVFVNLTVQKNSKFKSRNVRNIKIYWNMPTFQCKSHEINFTEISKKYKIIQNKNDDFRGSDIAILYDPGNFPAILKEASKIVHRNGGIPQEGDLTLHLKMFAGALGRLIPDEEFAGIGVIDFEKWRPIFRQNFGSPTEYKDYSKSIEKRKNPGKSQSWIEKEATKKFETHAKQFMKETLLLAKCLRPKATWGYYGYPFCFNMAPKNMKRDCVKQVKEENDRLMWLFETSGSLFPSIYMGQLKLNSNGKMDMIKGRINEARRVIKKVNTKINNPKLIPYFSYKYQDSKKFLSKEDLVNSFTVLSASPIDGIVLWGSSNDVNTKEKCKELYQYIDHVLGPLLLTHF